MRLYAFGSLILVSVFALLAHAEHIPQPPGPAYGGFIPGNWQHSSDENTASGCN